MAKGRGAQGAGTIRKRKDGRWESRITLGHNPVTGKPIQHSEYGKTQREVLDKMHRYQNDLENGVYIEPSKMTVKQWLEIWHTEYCGHLSDGSKHLYEGYVSKITAVLGAQKLQALTPPMVQSFYNGLKNERGKNKDEPMSPKSVNNIHGVLHKAMKQAVKVGYVRTNPTDACVLPKLKKPDVKPLTDEQIAAFLRLVKGHKYEILLIITLFLGLRQGEVVGLSWDSINYDKGTIYLYQQLQRDRKTGEYSLVPIKHGKTRTITPAETVLQYLRQQKKLQTELQLKAGTMWDNSKSLVFTDEVGRHLSPKSVYNNYKAIVRSMGCDFRFHDLRHSYATVAIHNGDDFKTLQGNLGHHTAAFTLATYAHVTEKANKESAARMDNFIQNIQQADA